MAPKEKNKIKVAAQNKSDKKEQMAKTKEIEKQKTLSDINMFGVYKKNSRYQNVEIKNLQQNEDGLWEYHHIFLQDMVFSFAFVLDSVSPILDDNKDIVAADASEQNSNNKNNKNNKENELTSNDLKQIKEFLKKIEYISLEYARNDNLGSDKFNTYSVISEFIYEELVRKNCIRKFKNKIYLKISELFFQPDYPIIPKITDSEISLNIDFTENVNHQLMVWCMDTQDPDTFSGPKNRLPEQGALLNSLEIRGLLQVAREVKYVQEHFTGYEYFCYNYLANLPQYYIHNIGKNVTKVILYVELLPTVNPQQPPIKAPSIDYLQGYALQANHIDKKEYLELKSKKAETEKNKNKKLAEKHYSVESLKVVKKNVGGQPKTEFDLTQIPNLNLFYKQDTEQSDKYDLVRVYMSVCCIPVKEIRELIISYAWIYDEKDAMTFMIPINDKPNDVELVIKFDQLINQNVRIHVLTIKETSMNYLPYLLQTIKLHNPQKDFYYDSYDSDPEEPEIDKYTEEQQKHMVCVGETFRHDTGYDIYEIYHPALVCSIAD